MNEDLWKRKAEFEKQATKRDSRICFGLVWFKTEEEANEYSQIIHELGITFNGGMFHGIPCGRVSEFDIKEGEYKYDEEGRMIASPKGKTLQFACRN